MSAIAISKDAGTNKNNGIHNSRYNRDILMCYWCSSPPSVTVLELNNKKGGCWGTFTNSLTC